MEFPRPFLLAQAISQVRLFRMPEKTKAEYARMGPLIY